MNNYYGQPYWGQQYPPGQTPAQGPQMQQPWSHQPYGQPFPYGLFPYGQPYGPRYQQPFPPEPEYDPGSEPEFELETGFDNDEAGEKKPKHASNNSSSEDDLEEQKGVKLLPIIEQHLLELSTAALVLAAVSLIMSFFPQCSVFVVVFAILSIALGVVPLIRTLTQGDDVNWVLVGGMIAALVAIAIAIIMTLLLPPEQPKQDAAISSSASSISPSGQSNGSIGDFPTTTSSSSSSMSVSSSSSASSSSSSSSSSTQAAPVSGAIDSTDGWIGREESAATTDLSLGSTVEFMDGFAVRVDRVDSALVNYDGQPISCITVTYLNASSDQRGYYEYDWKAVGENGEEQRPCYYSGASNELGSGKIDPNMTITGNIYFPGGITKALFKSSQLGGKEVSWNLTPAT